MKTSRCVMLVVLLARCIVGDRVDPLEMDIDWVIQGSELSSHGFFFELIGISSAMRTILPHCRVSKSFFNSSLHESAADSSSSILSQLFPSEKEHILQLTSPNRTYRSQGYSLKFNNMSRTLDISLCQEMRTFKPDTRHQFYNLARPTIVSPDPISVEKCCAACVEDPMCVAWSFGDDCSSGPGCSLQGQYIANRQEGEVTPLGSNCQRGSFVGPRAAPSSIGAITTRLPAPRAIIFHGTTCVYQNQSINTLPRDINTIWIGRYMLERGEKSFHSVGLNREEYEVIQCASRMDEIWVPTEWHRGVFSALSSQLNLRLPSVIVVPEAVDTKLFHPRSPDDIAQCTQSPGPFQFLSVFKWEHRKGWDVLLQAYWSVFSPVDNVVLRLHTYRPNFLRGDKNISQNIANYARNYFGKPLSDLAKVDIGCGDCTVPPDRSPEMTREEMRMLYWESNAFVLPTRGEGWCLPVAEAMSIGLPVIVTNYSGPTAYADNTNAFLVPLDDKDDLNGYVSPSVEILSQHMRNVFENPQTAAAKGFAARETMQKLSPEYVVSEMVQRLKHHANMRGWGVQ